MTGQIKARVGRPRAISRDEVVDAAVRLGLEHLTMKAVALRLGVTVATLYKYVADRDELYRLAATETMARVPLPQDTGQHWAEFACDFAVKICGALVSDRHVLDQLVHEGIGLDPELRLNEFVIDALIARGIAIEDAARLLDAIAVVTFGVAVRTHCARARTARHGSLRQAIDDTLEPLGSRAMPRLREAIEGSNLDAGRDPAQQVLRNIAPHLLQLAARRGEQLDLAALDRPYRGS